MLKKDLSDNAYSEQKAMELVGSLDNFVNSLAIDNSLVDAISKGVGDKAVTLSPFDRVLVGIVMAQITETEIVTNEPELLAKLNRLYDKLV